MKTMHTPPSSPFIHSHEPHDLFAGLFDETDELEECLEADMLAALASLRQPAAPELVLFSAEDVAALEAAAADKDNESRERLRALAKRLQHVRAARPLATLPADWAKKLDRLEEDFPNFAEFIDFLRDQFALAALGDGAIRLPPALFDGPPGIGKSELSRALAELIGVEMLKLDMASAQSGASLAGSDAFWSNSRVGRLFELLAFGRTANPLVFLDELDKIGSEERFRPDAALYQLLEPRSAAEFRDLAAMEVKLDASAVLWLAATNEVDRVAAPIRERFRVFSIPAPTPAQNRSIARALYRRLREDHPWGAAMAPELPEEVANALGSLSPRQMRQSLLQACGRAARQGRRMITPADLPTVSGSKPVRPIGFVAARP